MVVCTNCRIASAVSGGVAGLDEVAELTGATGAGGATGSAMLKVLRWTNV